MIFFKLKFVYSFMRYLYLIICSLSFSMTDFSLIHFSSQLFLISIYLNLIADSNYAHSCLTFSILYSFVIFLPILFIYVHQRILLFSICYLLISIYYYSFTQSNITVNLISSYSFPFTYHSLFYSPFTDFYK